MASAEDSRPFTVLHKMANEFKASLDSDIQQCLSNLDSQITNLVCNPDSKPATGKSTKLSVYVEFSKAKFDIFKSMKEIVEEMETSWKSQIQEIAKQFLENVEIFLASTKLESTAKSAEKPVQSNPKSPRLYPSLSLLNTAKHIPVLNSFLSNKDEVQGSPIKKSAKRLSTSPKKASVTVFESEKHIDMDNEIEISDDEVVSEEPENMEVEIEPDQLLLSRTARKSIATPMSSKKTPAKQVQFQENLSDDEVSTPVQRTRGRPKAVKTPVKKNTPQKKLPSITEDNSTADMFEESVSVSTPRGGRGRKSTKIEVKSTPKIVEEDSQVSNGHTPKVQMDIDDDLEIYSPVVNLSRSAPRRKTVVFTALNDVPAFNLTPDIARGRTKRKTMGFVNNSDVSVAPSPKRLKRGGRKSLAPSSLATEPEEPSVDPLESEESSETVSYSPWISLSDLTGQVPTKPGVYELRVFNAKKAAYIGACDNLRSKLTLHKLKQATGHKQLDRYVERNHGNVVVRYEVIEELKEAKTEEKKRVEEFSKMYNTTPAYN